MCYDGTRQYRLYHSPQRFNAVRLLCFDCGVLVRKKVHSTTVRPYLPPYSYRPHTRQTGRFVSSQRPLAL